MVSINQLTYEQVVLGTSMSLIYLCAKDTELVCLCIVLEYWYICYLLN